MITIGLPKILSIWSELLLAYEGINKFGKNTAEIYAYRLYDTELNDDLEDLEHKDIIAGRNLMEILTLFEDTYPCTITINEGIKIRDLEICGFDHRLHIKVIKDEEV